MSDGDVELEERREEETTKVLRRRLNEEATLDGEESEPKKKLAHEGFQDSPSSCPAGEGQE